MAQVRGSKKKNGASKQQVPDEIKEYYQAEKRDRMWVVWLLSGATFIVTVLVVLGLFWGGRWAWQRVNNDEPQTETASQPEVVDSEATNNAETNTPNETEHEGTNGQAQGETQGETPTGNNPPTTSANQTPATTPSTGDGTVLPSTGPSSDE